MKYRHRILRGATLAAVLGIALAAAPGTADTIRNHFDTDSIMRGPGFFDLVVLGPAPAPARWIRSEEHTSELQSRPHLVCRLLLEKKKKHLLSNQSGQTERKRTDCD